MIISPHSDSAQDYAGLTCVGLVDVDPEQARRLQAEFHLDDARIGTEPGDILEKTGETSDGLNTKDFGQYSTFYRGGA